jgi:2-keto-4-pentenoate hydratase/2-oxohepta-3-ene-1,7-dioic acid hydratase in catechol pathway
MGKDAKDVPKEKALEYVLGYTLSNDVSARKRMFAVPQWGLGKSFDSYLPVSS